MTIRNESRFFVLTILATAAWLFVPVTLFAAESTAAKPVLAQPSDGQCKRYVREHHSHPGKGVDTVKVVYVDRSRKQ